MKIVEELLQDKSDFSYRLFWNLSGPIFLLLTTALALQYPCLVACGILGLVLSCRYEFRGSVISLGSLILFGAYYSFYIPDVNLYFLSGLLLSYAISFCVIGLNATRQDLFLGSLFSQLQTRSDSLLNLEEEFSLFQKDAQKKHIDLQDKIDHLQKLLEEATSDVSCMTMLCDVLRKNAAKSLEDNESLQDRMKSLEISLSNIRLEKKDLEIDLDRLQSESSLFKENQTLLNDLNLLRIEKEKTQEINETVAKLYAKEYAKTKSLEESLLFAEEKQATILEEMALLEEMISSLKKEMLLKDLKIEECVKQSSHQESLILENRLLLAQKLELYTQKHAEVLELQSNLEILQQKLQNMVEKDTLLQLEADLLEKSQKIVSLESTLESFVPKSELDICLEKVKSLQHTESLYKQLKTQFEEKNQQLHVARKEVFALDNYIETQKLEALESDYTFAKVPKEVLDELYTSQQESLSLLEENQHLSELVALLSVFAAQEKNSVKKK